MTKDRLLVIPRNLLLIFHGDEILLQKGHKNKVHWANMYNALGGHMEKGEDVFSSSKRELFEEAGIDIPLNQIHLKGIISVKTYFNENCYMFVFAMHISQKDVKANEEGELTWVKLSNLEKIENIAEDIKILAPVIVNLPAGKFISGTSAYNEQRKLLRFDYHIVNT